MRVWHKQLIPKLCNRHLVALHNEANAIYRIIIFPKVIVDSRKYYQFCTGCGAENTNGKRCPRCPITQAGNLECGSDASDWNKFRNNPNVETIEAIIEMLKGLLKGD